MEGNETENALVPKTDALTAEYSHPGVERMVKLPLLRQMGVMVGLALSVAIGVAAVLWSQNPEYSLLYASVADKDVSEVLTALDTLGVKYKVESSTGAIMIPAESVHEVRLKLAAQGLPKTESIGFELLEKESSFGTSKSLEAARFQRALENEIARSVAAIQNVKSVRVHLAMPKQSVFVRQRKKPSASILVNLYSGRFLEKGQVQAILHLVASSVPQLEPGQVTIVDQRGTLLNSNDQSSEVYLSSKQFDYKKQVENHLMMRVENILSPLLGDDGLRTQVTADVDFTATERTHEQYNPDLPALRSEQTQEEASRLEGAQGVPGALSNQPPAAGTAPEEAGESEEEKSEDSPLNTSKSATRNYELDKTISHTRLATGVVRRLSVAVVIDDKDIVQQDGTVLKKPYSQEDIVQFTNLVKQAVGFNVGRGDQVTVTNSTFRGQEIPEALPEIPIWEKSWFRTLIKQLAAALVVLILIFGVLKPFMRGLLAPVVTTSTNESEDAEALRLSGSSSSAVGALEDGSADGASSSEEGGDPLLLEAPQSYEKRLEFAQKMVDEDPKRVAQVLKNWVTADG